VTTAKIKNNAITTEKALNGTLLATRVEAEGDDQLRTTQVGPASCQDSVRTRRKGHAARNPKRLLMRDVSSRSTRVEIIRFSGAGLGSASSSNFYGLLTMIVSLGAGVVRGFAGGMSAGWKEVGGRIAPSRTMLICRYFTRGTGLEPRPPARDRMQTQPAVLAYASEQQRDDTAVNVGYATVVPLEMILKIALAPLLLRLLSYRPPTASCFDEAQRETDQRRDREDDQDAEDADRPPAVQPAPLNRTDLAFDECRADETTDERVRRARRQASPPREEIPEHRPERTRADHDDGLRTRDGHDPGDRVGDGGPDQERAQHVEDRRQDDGLPRQAPRVATSVAIAFAASWKPFVSANARASETATHSVTRQTARRASPVDPSCPPCPLR
jgi:hypothetical protein